MWWAKNYGGDGPPCVFAEVGKKAKDVLSKGLSTGHMMLFFSHLTSTGASLSTTPILTSQGLLMATVSSSFKAAGVKADLSFTSPTNQVFLFLFSTSDLHTTSSALLFFDLLLSNLLCVFSVLSSRQNKSFHVFTIIGIYALHFQYIVSNPGAPLFS